MNRLFGSLFVMTVLFATVSLDASLVKHQKKVRDQYFVVFDGAAPAEVEGLAASVAKEYKAKVLETYPYSLSGALLEVKSQFDLNGLLSDSRVAFVEENFIIEGSLPRISAAQDTSHNYEYLWHLDRIDDRYYTPTDHTYRYNYSGANTVAYVLDGGVDATHPELQDAQGQSRVIESYDFRDDVPGVANPCANEWYGWHGTAVATALAGKNVGVAKDAQVVSVRVASCFGDLNAADYAQALNFLANPFANPTFGARSVTNLSVFGFPEDSSVMGYATARMVDATNTVFFTAADNSVMDACYFPPNNLSAGGPGVYIGYPYYATVKGKVMVVGATSVGATDNFDYRYQKWAFNQSTQSYERLLNQDDGSNAGPCVDIWAPGVSIYVGLHNGARDTATGPMINYGRRSGSSFASPIAAGVALRYLEKIKMTQSRNASYSEVMTALRDAGTYGQVGFTAIPEHWKCVDPSNYPSFEGFESEPTCPPNSTKHHQPALPNSPAPLLYYRD